MSCFTIIKEKGLKLTPQRRLILDIIHNTRTHLTTEEIIASVQAKMPGVNQSTIYRTLELLQETGCVFKSTLGDQSIYHHAEEGHHHHLTCRKCGKIVECDESVFAQLEESLDEAYGFSADFHHLVLSLK